MCRGVARGLGDCPDGWLGPLTPYVGDSRPERRVAAGTAGRRYLDILPLQTRGYHHDLTRMLSASDARANSVLVADRVLARETPCKRVASTRGFRKNGYKYMHEIKSDMDADLFTSLGSRLK